MSARKLTEGQIAIILHDYRDTLRSGSYYALKYNVPFSTMNRIISKYYNLQNKRLKPGAVIPELPLGWQAIKENMIHNTLEEPLIVRHKPTPQDMPTNLKVCVKCEATWPAEDKFCRNCGTKLYSKLVIKYKAKLRELVEQMIVYIPPDLHANALADFKKFDESLETFCEEND